MGYLTKEIIAAYKDKLERGIAEYMGMPAGERSANGVRGMLECWSVVDAAERSLCGGGADFTQADAEAWCAKMVNEDGTTGPHWTMEQTTAVAESVGVVFDQLAPWCWWAAMCMMYSDYCGVASRYGVGTAEFYADMAKAFLFDRDAGGPRAKMAAYYHGIAEHGK